jgi:uncharacterized phage infection (PIP) family protein YhgE
MSKTETFRQSAAASNENRLERLANQIEAVRQAKHQSAEDLAASLEPLAQAMAALTDETRRTLEGIDCKSKEQSETFRNQINAAAKSLKEAAAEAQKAANNLNQAGRQMGWKHYSLTLATGLFTAALVSGFWLWLAPPTVQNALDPEAVAKHLKPALIEALKPSKNK